MRGGENRDQDGEVQSEGKTRRRSGKAKRTEGTGHVKERERREYTSVVRCIYLMCIQGCGVEARHVLVCHHSLMLQIPHLHNSDIVRFRVTRFSVHLCVF